MEAAEKLSVTVTPAMARMIRERVEDGSYGSASEVIRAALRAFQREEEEHAERMASIRARVKASLEDKRPAVPLDEAIDRVKSRISQLARDNDDPASRRRS
ncbi:MAG: type II toxin-antitoxin system ParD family antitoxin [Mesorhizobium sp.]|uniref:type II toxin-antitoxin system ParD family antitoxin n=1 Tax=Mesorhizobium sp. TaxID=1871066 RepID=UPI000FE521A4|nr:type II toxin-antitoxin system ParD family antitoxin [Mesorhizobium sp.]RWD63224.1 MAG: type II toxin-antitoxin system ParD family antitoxin [Mesorhizobium sp.]RWE48492.1 MAG: type II toxin-antitoxin system ParD family antitoxin [Mesorhizobium sp.]TIV72821.1 MAG: type II toxin-antitoxin system ParD family antitoxin [Mesorhizobium sp.]